MKKRFLISTVALLSVLGLAGCKKTTSNTSNASAGDSAVSTESPKASDTVTAKVSITNKAKLTEVWHLGEANRQIEFNLDPAGNPNALITSGDLKISSSDPTKVAVMGTYLAALSAGKVTITVNYKGATDTVDVEVLAKQTNKDIFGTEHEGTEADPFTNEDAIKAASSGKASAADEYFITGTVASFYAAPGARTDGMVAFYLEPATEGGAKFEVYKCFNKDGSNITEDQIWVGAEVVVSGSLTMYNTQAETSAAKLISVKGTKPVIADIEATVAEALEATKALADNDSSQAYYIITGYITQVTADGFYMSDTKGKKTNTQDDFLVYGWKGDTASRCTVDAKVKVTATLKKYVSTSKEGVHAYETSVIKSVEILEDGQAEAPATEATVAKALEVIDALADGASTEGKYAVTGFIISATTWSSQYKNFDIVIADTADAKTGLTVFRVSAETQEAADAYAVGTKVKATGFLQKYVNKDKVVTPELTSPVVVILEKAPASLNLDKTEAQIGLGDTLTLKATLVNAEGTITWTSSDETVATVKDGVVTPLKAGQTTIKATAGELSAECVVTVVEAIDYGTKEAPLTITAAKALLDKTGKGNLTAQKITVKGVVSSSTKGKNGYTIWLQSDDGATEQDFELYNVKLDASITADYTADNALRGKTIICKGWGELYKTTYEITSKKISDNNYDNGIVLSVEDSPAVAPTAIKLDAAEATVAVDKTLKLTPSFTPANAAGEITWSSSDEKIATVADGVVTGVAAGEATITAKVGELTATCKVTVTATEIKSSVYTFNATNNSKGVGGYKGVEFTNTGSDKSVITVTNWNNNSNKWDFIKCGS